MSFWVPRACMRINAAPDAATTRASTPSSRHDTSFTPEAPASRRAAAGPGAVRRGAPDLGPARELLAGRPRLRARTRRFAADVDDVGPLGEEGVDARARQR